MSSLDWDLLTGTFVVLLLAGFWAIMGKVGHLMIKEVNSDYPYTSFIDPQHEEGACLLGGPLIITMVCLEAILHHLAYKMEALVEIIYAIKQKEKEKKALKQKDWD